MGNLARIPEDLIPRCLSKDQTAWEQLYQWLDVLFSKCGQSFFYLSAEESQDAFHWMLLELFQHDCQALRSFSARSRPETYLFSIARRVAADLRSRRLACETLDDFVSRSTAGEAEFQRADFWLVAEHHLPYGDLLLLRLVAAGLSQAEIGEALAPVNGRRLSPDSVAVQKHRALRRLRQALQSDKNAL